MAPNVIPNQNVKPPPLIEVDGEEHYIISEILDSKIDHRRKKCPLLYYIRWKGYEGTDDELAWVLADDVAADKSITNFHAKYHHKPGLLNKLLNST